MSTLTRTAKSWRSWSTDDLLAFNIQVIPEDPQAFFGVHLSAPNVPSMILDHIEYIRDSQEGPPTRTATHFFFRLREVMERPDEVSAVHDFILFLLETLEFNSMKGFVMFGTKIPFTMCGKDVIAKPDIVVIDPSGVKRYRLLIQLAKVIVMQPNICSKADDWVSVQTATKAPRATTHCCSDRCVL